MNPVLTLEKIVLKPLEKISIGVIIQEYSTEKVYKLANKLLDKIKRTGYNFDVIIGIARSGIPLARYLSEKLNIEMDIIGITKYSNSRFDFIPFLQGIDSTVKITKLPKSKYEGKLILLVDDDCATGETIKTAKEHFKGKVNPLTWRIT